MRKITAVLLTVVMAFSLAACGSQDETDAAASTAAQTEAAETTAAEETDAGESAEQTEASQSAGNETADIVIIGGGAAGMSAAIKAAASDVRIILLEKQGFLGGASAMASTGINAGGSDLQMETEVPYTADQFYEYALSWDYGYDRIGYRVVPVREDYAYTFAYNSADAAEWIESLGVKLAASSESHSLQLADKSQGGFGSVYVSALLAELEKYDNIDVRTNSPAVEITADENGAVSGVVVSGSDGEYTIDTTAVLIASGGYASADSEFYQTYAPAWDGYYSYGAAGATGDGIVMADSLGAQLLGMDAITCTTATVGEPNQAGALSVADALKGGAVLVNSEGERFVNESAGTADMMEAIKAQTDACAYLIADAATLEETEALQAVQEAGKLSEGATAEELAKALGLDAETLAGTIASVSEGIAAGADEYENETFVSDYAEGPYYGVLVKPARRIATGGIVTNGNAEVLDENDTPITGLYAAGEVTAYGAHPLSAATIFGRQAADSIVAFLGK